LPGTFDPSIPVRIEVQKIAPGSPGVIQHFSVAAGDIEVRQLLKYYVLWWRLPASATTGSIFRVSVYAATLELARADLQLVSSIGGWISVRLAGDNSSIFRFRDLLPIRIFLNTQAVSSAEEEAANECETDPGVIDCDVEVIQNEDGGEVEVLDESNQNLAAKLTAFPGDVVDGNGNPVSNYILRMAHLPLDTKPSSSVPEDRQFPFIVRATITDAMGNPLFFDEGATLVLCQPPDLETNSDAFYYNPSPQSTQQQIIKVDDGVTSFLDTEYGAPECEGNGGILLRPRNRLGHYMRSGLERLANLFLPQPLRATHGGLVTIRTIGDLSEFAAALATDPSVSTADVPDGTVGEATTIEIQANLAATIPQTKGDDDVRVTITGANTATLTVGNEGVTDNGDGTYTASYTPANAGTDNVAITILNLATGNHEPISGSPFTSVVSSASIPSLVAPASGEIVAQNNATQCSLHAARGRGYTLTFDWTGVAGATGYEVEAWVVGAAIPFYQATTSATETQATQVNCNAIAPASNGDGSFWRVRALFPQGAGSWSADVFFGFGQCVLASLMNCYAPQLTAVNVTPATASVVPGGVVQLTANPVDQFDLPYSDPFTVLWSSSATTIATVNTSGLVTGIGFGQAVITATVVPAIGGAPNAQSGTATINVIVGL
jgi:hypothetical protein